MKFCKVLGPYITSTLINYKEFRYGADPVPVEQYGIN